jgi:hypothetical protein
VSGLAGQTWRAHYGDEFILAREKTSPLETRFIFASHFFTEKIILARLLEMLL